MVRYSQMTKGELLDEIQRLENEQMNALREGWESQAEMFKQKRNLARSYLVEPTAIKPNQLYQVEEQDSLFRVAYLNGVMAWGHLENSAEEIALPLAVLHPRSQKCCQSSHTKSSSN
ncbi:DUF1811 family protein [Hazenella coriacea]|uniref:Uncharacterized protein DUF1811 n=1 Tax=Hazenella coriacea TaxID=1179467 RepID=A0A4R3L7R4_9BACL|nr:DUF1811 family protein [Hazenella coriacea]TCS95823.1 uncharacterized protein DUF1811 [Hazenella coriacea]